MDYIKTHLVGLRNLASKRKAHMLAYLIDIAIAETAEILAGRPTVLTDEQIEKCKEGANRSPHRRTRDPGKFGRKGRGLGSYRQR